MFDKIVERLKFESVVFFILCNIGNFIGYIIKLLIKKELKTIIVWLKVKKNYLKLLVYLKQVLKKKVTSNY